MSCVGAEEPTLINRGWGTLKYFVSLLKNKTQDPDTLRAWGTRQF